MIEIIDDRTGEVMDADSVPGLAAIAAMHDDRIADLQSRVEQLDEADDRDPANVGPYVWHTLDANALETLWAKLADWVGWLRGRYPLARKIPACWWRHPELVEEVTALWLAWRDAYTDAGSPLTAGADWHARWLPEFIRRIGAGGWNVGCEGQHKEPIPGLYDARSVDDPAEFSTFVDSAAQNRRTKQRTTQQEASMQTQAIEAALANGEARVIGALPGSPVVFSGSFWVETEEGWLEIDDESTINFLRDAERRLDLADEAVDGDDSR